MKVRSATVGSGMAGSRPSEFVVHAGTGGLDDKVRRTVKRIGAARGVDDGAERIGGREARKQIFELERPMVRPGVFPPGADSPTHQRFRARCGAGARKGA